VEEVSCGNGEGGRRSTWIVSDIAAVFYDGVEVCVCRDTARRNP